MVQILDCGAKLEDETLKLLESFIGVGLPKKYRLFMSEYNGGCPEPSSFYFADGDEGSSINCFFGINRGNSNDWVRCFKVYLGRIPEDTLPIAADAFGNLICIGIKGKVREKIFFWDHELEKSDGELPDYSNMKLIANNFEVFLSGLYELEF